MATGLLALLDDVVALAKVAAASIDDVAGQAARASLKVAGVAIDDAAVTPRYVVGMAADRELPIIWKIALGSLRNKLLFLLPAALALSWFAPWAITPILMIGGVYLCYEGAAKVVETLSPRRETKTIVTAPVDATEAENLRVAGAIRTDFILSAEIMALSLSTLPEGDIVNQAIVLAVVGVGITIAIYGTVALIVRADDLGVRMTQAGSAVLRSVGAGIVRAMPTFLKILSVVGTVAMLWVGGGILIHGLHEFDLNIAYDLSNGIASSATSLVGIAPGVVSWTAAALFAGVLGMAVGAVVVGAKKMLKVG